MKRLEQSASRPRTNLGTSRIKSSIANRYIVILVVGMIFDISCTWTDAYRLMCGQRYGTKNKEQRGEVADVNSTVALWVKMLC